LLIVLAALSLRRIGVCSQRELLLVFYTADLVKANAGYTRSPKWVSSSAVIYA